jgi:hypothetical protein
MNLYKYKTIEFFNNESQNQDSSMSSRAGKSQNQDSEMSSRAGKSQLGYPSMVTNSFVKPQLSQYKQQTSPELKLSWDEYTSTNTSEPKVWGPALWFVLHTCAAHYPINGGSPVAKAKIKGFIEGLPYFLPCSDCGNHAQAFIDSRNLDEALESRKTLFEFFVDFHNKVNERHRKPLMSATDAYNLYKNTPKIRVLKYN